METTFLYDAFNGGIHHIRRYAASCGACVSAAAKDGANFGNINFASGACGDFIRTVIFFSGQNGNFDAVYTSNDVDNVISVFIFKSECFFIFFCAYPQDAGL